MSFFSFILHKTYSISNQKPRYIQHSAPNIQAFPNSVQMSEILEPMKFIILMAWFENRIQSYTLREYMFDTYIVTWRTDSIIHESKSEYRRNRDTVTEIWTWYYSDFWFYPGEPTSLTAALQRSLPLAYFVLHNIPITLPWAYFILHDIWRSLPYTNTHTWQVD